GSGFCGLGGGVISAVVCLLGPGGFFAVEWRPVLIHIMRCSYWSPTGPASAPTGNSCAYTSLRPESDLCRSGSVKPSDGTVSPGARRSTLAAREDLFAQQPRAGLASRQSMRRSASDSSPE